MPGRHTDPSRSSVGGDLVRFVVLLAILAVVLIGGAWILTGLLGSDGEGAGIDATEATTRATSTTAQPSSTTTSSAGTTTSAPESTSTTSAPTTTVTSTTATTEAPTTTGAVALDPSQVSVLVLNSTTRSGLAARLVQRLDALGYQTPEPSNYADPLDQSRVWYVEGFEPEAAAVAALIPDALVEVTPLDSPSSPITVVLGASFSE